MHRKFIDSAVVADSALGPRQIRVIANSGKPDRVGDVIVASGGDFKNYQENPIVLADHAPNLPVGTSKVYVAGERVEAIITFAPAGASAKADEYCALAKFGVLRAVSIGFRSIEREPIKSTGGNRFTKWELIELSLVTTPCDPGALVIQRNYRKSGRVLSSENAELLHRMAKCLSKSQACHGDAVDMLEEADRHRRKAMRHAARIAANAAAGGGQATDPETDVELSYAARQRTVEVLALAHRSAGDADYERRMREIEVLGLAQAS